MPKGVRLTLQQKREIAADFVAGKEIPFIAQERGLDVNNLYNMRKNDRVYQDIERDLSQAMDEKFRTRVRRTAHDVLENMKAMADMEVSNETTTETRVVVDEKGRRLQVIKRNYKIDAKLVYIKYQANERLLDAFLRVIDGEARAQNSERIFEQRQALLCAYGITPPALPVVSRRRSPSSLESDSAQDAELIEEEQPVTENVTLATLLQDIIPSA